MFPKNIWFLSSLFNVYIILLILHQEPVLPAAVVKIQYKFKDTSLVLNKH